MESSDDDQIFYRIFGDGQKKYIFQNRGKQKKPIFIKQGKHGKITIYYNQKKKQKKRQQRQQDRQQGRQQRQTGQIVSDARILPDISAQNLLSTIQYQQFQQLGQIQQQNIDFQRSIQQQNKSELAGFLQQQENIIEIENKKIDNQGNQIVEKIKGTPQQLIQIPKKIQEKIENLEEEKNRIEEQYIQSEQFYKEKEQTYQKKVQESKEILKKQQDIIQEKNNETDLLQEKLQNMLQEKQQMDIILQQKNEVEKSLLEREKLLQEYQQKLYTFEQQIKDYDIQNKELLSEIEYKKNIILQKQLDIDKQQQQQSEMQIQFQDLQNKIQEKNELLTQKNVDTEELYKKLTDLRQTIRVSGKQFIDTLQKKNEIDKKNYDKLSEIQQKYSDYTLEYMDDILLDDYNLFKNADQTNVRLKKMFNDFQFVQNENLFFGDIKKGLIPKKNKFEISKQQLIDYSTNFDTIKQRLQTGQNIDVILSQIYDQTPYGLMMQKKTKQAYSKGDFDHDITDSRQKFETYQYLLQNQNKKIEQLTQEQQNLLFFLIQNTGTGKEQITEQQHKLRFQKTFQEFLQSPVSYNSQNYYYNYWLRKNDIQTQLQTYEQIVKDNQLNIEKTQELLQLQGEGPSIKQAIEEQKEEMDGDGYKQDYKTMIQYVKKNGMSLEELQNIGNKLLQNFVSVYMADDDIDIQQYVKKPFYSMIINSATRKNFEKAKLKHWYVLFFDNRKKKNTVYFYDSLNNQELKHQVLKKVHQLVKNDPFLHTFKIVKNKSRDQGSTRLCGLWSVYMILKFQKQDYSMDTGYGRLQQNDQQFIDEFEDITIDIDSQKQEYPVEVNLSRVCNAITLIQLQGAKSAFLINTDNNEIGILYQQQGQNEIVVCQISISTGYYTVDQLIQEIQTKFNQQVITIENTTYTLTFSKIQPQIVFNIAFSQAPNIQLGNAKIAILGNLSVILGFQTETQFLYQQEGNVFYKNIENGISNYTATSPFQLNQQMSINVFSDIIQNREIGDNYEKLLESIGVSTLSYTQFFTWENNHEHLSRKYTKILQPGKHILKFWFLDQNGQKIQFQDNQQLTVYFILFYVDENEMRTNNQLLQKLIEKL